MLDCLPGIRPGVKDNAVAVAGDPFGNRHLMGVGDDVSQQTVTGSAELGHGGVVCPRDHQDMHGRLRVDIAEGDRPRSGGHYGRRDLASGNAAEQTVWHGPILTCSRRVTLRADMVALQTHAAPTPLAHWSRQLLAFPSLRAEYAREHGET